MANGVPGAYMVTALGNGISGSSAYSLENVVLPVANAVSATVAYGSVGNVIALNITGGTPTSVAVSSAGEPWHGHGQRHQHHLHAHSRLFRSGQLHLYRYQRRRHIGPGHGDDHRQPPGAGGNAVSATVAYNSSNNVIPLNITGGTPTSVAVSTRASHGTATASGTSIAYTPPVGYSGPDSFTYTATNAGGTSAPAMVTITVNPQAPVANAVSATVAYGSVGNAIAVNITGGTPTSVAVASGGGAWHGHCKRHRHHLHPRPRLFRPGQLYLYRDQRGRHSAPATVTITVNPQRR